MRPVALATVLWLLLPPVVSAQERSDALPALLQEQMLLSATDVSAVTRGHIVSTLPATRDPREIAAYGIVRVNATGAAFIDAVLDVDRYMRTTSVLQIGRFSTRPSLDDVAGLTLDEPDLQGLRRCRAGHCAIKLSATMVERFAREVRWSAPDWREQATRLFRQMLVDYVTTYVAEGNSALPEYVDQSSAVNLADETRALQRQLPYGGDYAPELFGRPGPAPTTRPPSLTHVIYWSKEQFGFKPTITVSDVAIYAPAAAGADSRALVAASTQLYATHYFEGSVALTIATTIAAPPAQPGFYMVHLHRSRIDSLRGGFAWLKRFTAGRRIRNRLEGDLRQHKDYIESTALRQKGRGAGAIP